MEDIFTRNSSIKYKYNYIEKFNDSIVLQMIFQLYKLKILL